MITPNENKSPFWYTFKSSCVLNLTELKTSGEAYCGDIPVLLWLFLIKLSFQENKPKIKKKNKPKGAVWIFLLVTANPKSQITALISSGLFVCPLSIKIYFKWLVFEQEEKV